MASEKKRKRNRKTKQEIKQLKDIAAAADEESLKQELLAKGRLVPAGRSEEFIEGEIPSEFEESSLVVSSTATNTSTGVKVARVFKETPMEFEALVALLKKSYKAATGKDFIMPRSQERAEQMRAEVEEILKEKEKKSGSI